MEKCVICGKEINEGHMCPDCMGGFENKMVNCKICGKLNNDNICVSCLSEYVPQLKEFVDKYPGMTYLEAVFHRCLPVPRNVLYEITQAGIIKMKG